MIPLRRRVADFAVRFYLVIIFSTQKQEHCSRYATFAENEKGISIGVSKQYYVNC